jgi:hypothetical protein
MNMMILALRLDNTIKLSQTLAAQPYTALQTLISTAPRKAHSSKRTPKSSDTADKLSNATKHNDPLPRTIRRGIKDPSADRSRSNVTDADHEQDQT